MSSSKEDNVLDVESEMQVSGGVSLAGGRPFVALASLCLAELLVAMDNSIVNVAIPTFSREMDASNTALQWIVDAYTLTFSCFLLPAGHLGDRVGRRLVLMVGLAGFGVLSVFTALSGGLIELIACRGALGVFAALIYPATLSLITSTFAGTSYKNLAIGMWAATSGIGIAFGPILGGILLEYYSWAAIFWINVPLSAFGLLALWRGVPESRAEHGARFDVLGASLATCGVGMIVWGIIEGPHRGWVSVTVSVPCVVGLCVCLLMVAWELRCRYPLFDVRLFAHRQFAAGALSICIGFFALAGFIFVITQYFQMVRGYSALVAGLATLPFAAVMAGLSPVAPVLARRLGVGVVVGVGLAVMGVAYASDAVLDERSSYWGLVVPEMIVIAAGLALVQAPATSAIMDVAKADEVGAASAMNDTTREVGGTFGVAVIGSVVAGIFAPAVASAVSALELPSEIREQASASVSAAIRVAERLPAPQGRVLHDAALAAFIEALHYSVILIAVTVWVGAVIAVIALPRRRMV